MTADLSPTPGSVEAVSFMKKCLEQCALIHAACEQKNRISPTRLLDVEHLEKDIIRLVEPESHATAHYVALSYCWGTAEVFKTVKSNLSLVKSGVQASTLPKSIQDAALLSHTLGFRYLWVDALCIIQDSAKDWDIESAKMGSVYENAYVTLVASLASSAGDGFLSNFLPSRQRDTFSLEISADGKTNEQPTLVKAIVATKTSESDTDISDNPLDTRAWCFQESVLSTRAILITKEEIRWSCRSEKTCECKSDFHPQQHWPSINDIKTAADAFAFWKEMVHRYSSRRLTYNKDKLIALSGIAQVVSQFTCAKYIAGIWSENLVAELAWRRIHSSMENASSRVEWGFMAEYQAPSFSWASIQGVVDSLPRTHVQDIHSWNQTFSLIDMHVSQIGLNPFGAVSGGYIKVHGYLVQATMAWRDRHRVDPHYCVFTDSWETIHWLVDSGLDTDIEEFVFINADGQEEKSVRRCPSIPVNAMPVFSPCPVFLFCIGILQREEHLEWNTGSHVFLILARSPKNPTQRFERIGLLQTREYRPEDWPECSKEAPLSTITIV